MKESPPLLNVEYWFRYIYELIVNRDQYSFEHLFLAITNAWHILTYVSYVLAFGLIWFLVYVVMLSRDFAKEDEERFATIEPKEAEKEIGHSRWEHVEELMNGLQESDWRQAIIEADIMLDDVLESRGYTGAGTGDRLKQLSPSFLPSLDALWDAHKIRNRIAHEGSAFSLDERIAYRTIQSYRRAFIELGVF